MSERLAVRRYAPWTVEVFLALAIVGLFALLALIPHGFATPEGLQSGGAALMAPNADHPLGTDVLGRDAWARLVQGARTSLAISALATGIALMVGIAGGALAALLGGWWDDLLMRSAEVADSIPALLLALLFVALLGPGLVPVALVIGLTGWLPVARLTRAEILLARRLPYVDAIRALGGNRPTLLVRHVGPEVLIPLLALIPFRVEGAIVAEAGLSFLGVEDATRPSWGSMLRDAQPFLLDAWWLLAAPAVALALLLFALALLADQLQRSIDPNQLSKVSRPRARPQA